MENASKALLISGGIILAVLLLTLFSYLIRQMGDSTAGIYSKLSEHDISEFNQKFLNYERRGIDFVVDEEGNKIYNPLTTQDLVTLINLAKDNNENPKFPTTISIFMGSTGGTNLVSKDYIDLLKKKKDSLQTYNCEIVHINSETMLVDYIIIKYH